MRDLLPSLLVFSIAGGVTGTELVTGKYTRTPFALMGCHWFYVYCAGYGLIAFVSYLSIDYLVAEEALKLEGFGLSNPWLKALFVGISTKAFLHINLFNVSSASRTFPVGIESFVQLFESWLLEEIELYHFNAVRALLAPWSQKYNNLDEVKKVAKANIPRTFREPMRAAFGADIEKATSPLEVLEIVLYYLGRRSLKKIFP